MTGSVGSWRAPLLSQPSEAEEGSVIEVVQKGYRLGDKVLRPARVVIAAPTEG